MPYNTRTILRPIVKKESGSWCIHIRCGSCSIDLTRHYYSRLCYSHAVYWTPHKTLPLTCFLCLVSIARHIATAGKPKAVMAVAAISMIL